MKTLYAATPVLTLLVLALLVPVAAQDATEPGTAPAQPVAGDGPDLAAAIRALADTARFVGVTSEEKPDAGRMGGMGQMMVAGMGDSDPYQGKLEILRQNDEVLVLSGSILPGFAVLQRGERRARTMTYDDTPVAIDEITRDLQSLLDLPALAAAADAAEWQHEQFDSGSAYTGRLAKSLLRKPARRRGPMAGMGMQMQAKVLDVRAHMEVDATGAITAITVEIDRADPLAGMMAQFGRGGENDGDRVGTTRMITLRPSADAPTKRAKRVRLELLAALARPRPEGAGTTTAGTPRVTLPRPAARPEDVRARFEKTIARYDTNADGRLSRDETQERWLRLAKYDTNNDEMVDLEELIAGYQARKKASQPEPDATPDAAPEEDATTAESG